MTRRTSLKITDERQRLLDKASAIVASAPHDDPPMSDVLDAALTHLVESKENIDSARGELDPETIQRFNTSVIGLRYRTSVESRWR
ncbi:MULTISPECIES: DUF7386 family protein [Halomicrobium]|uniref:Uncharacterized protein n=2 Tax=Halomicrobium mukohataei TaxID=57705 RepID=C7NYC6_HALMD|nr:MULTISPECIES: hypothetical protein [Halomicrobium]ACV46587.1 conserved hypothetical protein [Halomicrobium mukohataei DSM 12286]QCD65127.1 hypothetical protein E5139_05525 [Halomicrobium mukohataei]QFR19933.1 hypothetical protein GBQ70_05520 [Halomicrobium sp. ZPS1]